MDIDDSNEYETSIFLSISYLQDLNLRQKKKAQYKKNQSYNKLE